MRKYLLALFVIILTSGAAFGSGYGEINVKLGLDLISALDSNEKNAQGVDSEFVSASYKTGFSISGEYLCPVLNTLKLGAGIEYLFPRKADGNWKNYAIGIPEEYSGMPVYIVLQINPIEDGFFIKGSLGYVVFFDRGDTNWSMRTEPDGAGNSYEAYMEVLDKKGGVYYGLAMGHEFGFGLIIEASIDCYNGSSEYRYGSNSYNYDTMVSQNDFGKYTKDTSFYKAGIKVGYKVKL